jgi:MarR family transcriptional regulator, 2-MHQ and catechol-resistance regulon repressor
MKKKRPSRPGSKANASGLHLWLVLWRASRALEAHARRSIAGLGMCPSDFGVLEALLHKGPQAVSQLGTKVLLTSGSITTAVDRLERLGFVRRRPDKRDRRTRMVHLTARGRQVIRAAFAEHEQALERATSALTAGERAAAIQLLRKLGQSAEQRS